MLHIIFHTALFDNLNLGSVLSIIRISFHMSINGRRALPLSCKPFYVLFVLSFDIRPFNHPPGVLGAEPLSTFSIRQSPDGKTRLCLCCRLLKAICNTKTYLACTFFEGAVFQIKKKSRLKLQ